MARPYWSGNLQISLVSIGVQLFPATNSTGEISFHQIQRSTGKRVHHQNVVGGTPVDRSEIVKGYEYSKGNYIVVEPQEVERLRIATKHTLEITQFVDAAELPPALYEKPYFMVPQAKEQGAAYRVIRDALEQNKKVGLGKIAFAGREHLIGVTAAQAMNVRGLMAYTLRFGDEMRAAAEYYPDVTVAEPDKREIAMANELIERYSAPLDLSQFKDEYEAALRALIEAKQKNEPLPLDEAMPRREKVVNLMDALRLSLERDGAAKTKAKPRDESGAEEKGPRLVKPAKARRKVA